MSLLPGHVVRFVIDTAITYAASGGLERAQFLNLWNIITLTNTTAVRIFNAIKIRKVEMWSPVSAGASAADFGIEWSSQYGPFETVNGTTQGTARPGHLMTRPPKGSVAGFWSLAGVNESEIVMYIWGPAGTVVDFHLTGSMSADGAASATSVSPSGATGVFAIKTFSSSFVASGRIND
jgi:hypothetical protein